jgi:hypothetical protein
MSTKFYRHPEGFLDDTDFVEVEFDKEGKAIYAHCTDKSGERNFATALSTVIGEILAENIWEEIPDPNLSIH